MAVAQLNSEKKTKTIDAILSLVYAELSDYADVYDPMIQTLSDVRYWARAFVSNFWYNPDSDVVIDARDPYVRRLFVEPFVCRYCQNKNNWQNYSKIVDGCTPEYINFGKINWAGSCVEAEIDFLNFMGAMGFSDVLLPLKLKKVWRQPDADHE